MRCNNLNEKIVISIVTHNSRHIFEVLDNLQREVGNDSKYEINIFDNGSEKDYLVQLERYGSLIILHKSEKNHGFGYGHNYILKRTAAKYGIIFNPDILLTKQVMDNMIERLMSDEQVAMVCPKVLNADGTTQYLVRQKLDVFDYMLRFIPFKFIKKMFHKRLNFYECRDLPDSRTSYIKMGSGCLMVIETAVFKQIDGFDERFFMYFEDNDLCLRFGQEGYRILYTPFETVTHLYEKGAHKSKKLFIIFLQSMAKFFNKWGWKLF